LINPLPVVLFAFIILLLFGKMGEHAVSPQVKLRRNSDSRGMLWGWWRGHAVGIHGRCVWDA
jgi:hypothetical protein